MSLFLPKLDSIHTITSFLVYGHDADPLFTYMSNPTTSSEWGLPKLENLTIYDCDYDPERLLEMVLARYGGQGSEGDNNSDDGRDRPPPFQELTIGHAPGEADIDTLDLVEDIVGNHCFTLEEDVER
ncbi:hypothetical protein M407DRAFT_240786 [Tulasnella calospora MUT 4182]|uniref:Uncharacterized protein n=1 Tax=Tulasnella calospora MUT 4182 TaxID=1051891 RepID=A0A0C3QWI8_9AGAM|nr:hypothetical protein M407DRAFT_240786 [Tulasnella calospora MUT 4182]